MRRHAGSPRDPDAPEAYTFLGFKIRRGFARKPKTKAVVPSARNPDSWQEPA